MKKQFIVVAAAAMILFTSGCSGWKIVAEMKASEMLAQNESTEEVIPENTTEIAVSTTEEDTTEESTEESTEEEHEYLDIELGQLNARIDTTVWMPIEDYIVMREEAGKPFESDDLDFLRDPNKVSFILRDSTYGEELPLIFTKDEFPGITGYATEEDYKKYAELMEYIMYTQADDLKEVKSIVDSRNGIMYSETNITYQNASKAKEISYLKDDTQYMIMFLGYLTLNEKDLYYDIIDSITFDE